MHRVSVSTTRGTARRISVVSAVVVLLATLVSWLGAPAAAGAAVRPGDVTMTVADVRPNTPTLSHTPEPLNISVTLVNNTGQTLKDVTISAARSDPINTQDKLDAAIARPKPPSSDQVAPLKETLKETLAPHATVDVLYQARTDIPTDTDLCLCANAIYPIYFTADYTPTSGPTVRLAVAQTYLPSFKAQPAKMQVSWMWPLLDRPHRFYQVRTFRDDDLAKEIAPGGRLDQLLEVVEKVGNVVPMTLVTDPDLIDELQVMQTGYRIKVGKAVVPGTGGPLAAAWLARLRAVLANDKMELTFTTWADPDVEAVSQAGLSWSTGLSNPAQASAATKRVSLALGGTTPPADITWPVGLTITKPTLSTLVGQGVKTVIVNDRTLPKGSTRAVIPDALAPLPTDSTEAIAAVTSSPIERWVTKVLDVNGPGLAALPELVAEMAIRVVTSPHRSHYVVITPPRLNLTVVPRIAERAILATALTPWSSPLPLRAAINAVAPVSHGQLAGRTPSSQLPAATATNLLYIAQTLPGLGSLYLDDAARKLALGNVPTAVQRCESSSLVTQPARSIECSSLIADKLRAIRDGVHVAKPSDGTYTLASKNSRLPVTIVNTLADRVRVQVRVTTVNDVPGFNANPVDRTIDPNTTVQLRIPTHVDRVGRIDVQVGLFTPGGVALGGPPVPLTVHSTALGTIGVVITIVAAVVLIIALLVRLIRRLRRRRRQPAKRPKVEPVPAATAAP
jgi:Family of unknown function (DUF6049)